MRYNGYKNNEEKSAAKLMSPISTIAHSSKYE